MNNSQMIGLLTILLVIFIMLLFVLIGILVFKKVMQNNKAADNDETPGGSETKLKETVFKSYTKDSIYNFMEFEKVEDSMIIQKKRKKISYGSRM